jgi:putative membrane protein
MKRLLALSFAAVGMGALVSDAVAAEPIRVNLEIGRAENFDDVPNKTGLNAMDKKFMKHMAYINMFEIKAGELAQKKGRQFWTRNYGWEMEREHTMAWESLKNLASKNGFDLPDTLDSKHRNILAKLERAEGNRFDELYHKVMVSGHGDAERLAAQAIKYGNDVFVRSHASIATTTTNMHQMLARHEELMVSNPNATGGRLAQPIKP